MNNPITVSSSSSSSEGIEGGTGGGKGSKKSKSNKTSSENGTADTTTTGGNASGASGKGSKPPSIEPTASQINAMIEDLVMLAGIDIDSIQEVPDIVAPVDLVVESDSDDDLLPSFGNQPTSRLKKLHKRDRHYEVRKAWDIYEEKVQARKEALLLLEEATQTGVEKSLRTAIKRGVSAGLKWKERGKVYCALKMKDVSLNTVDI